MDKNRGLLEGLIWQFEEENMKFTLHGAIFVMKLLKRCNFVHMGYLSEESIICEKYGVLIKVWMKTLCL